MPGGMAMLCCSGASTVSTLVPARPQSKSERKERERERKIARMLRKAEGMWRERRRHTFSIALLVGATFHTLFPLLSLRVDALFSDAVLDAAETGTGVVAFLASLLAVGACVLDLPAF